MIKHKKALLPIILLALMWAVFLPVRAESSEITANSIFGAIRDKIVLPEMIEVPADLISDYYGIYERDYSEAVFMICFDSMLADEIVIAKAADSEAVRRISEALEARKRTKADEARSYSPEQYAIIQKSSVRSDGLFVSLLVSPDAKLITEIYMDVLVNK